MRRIPKATCAGQERLHKILFLTAPVLQKLLAWYCPNLKGKLDGSAQRVPTITGSLTELTTILGKKVTVEEVNAAMKAAANESFGYTEDEIVSTDIIGINFGLCLMQRKPKC